jgi:hypothetical protein
MTNDNDSPFINEGDTSFDHGYNTTEAGGDSLIQIARYARVEPGEYTAHIVKAHRYRDGRYGVDKLRVEFVLDTGETVSRFYNMPRDGKPVGFRHEVRRLLVLASNYAGCIDWKRLPNPDVFYRVRVCDAGKGQDVYSVVRDVLGRL